MAYKKDYIIKMCEEQLDISVKKFYDAEFVNYTGITSDTEEYYSEIIAEFVIENLSQFEKITPITRQKTYKTASHTGEYTERTNQEEEYIAKDMFNECKSGEYSYIGKIIDYQTPLYNDKAIDGIGSIDLLAHNKDSLYILELKRPYPKENDNPETMLKCVLEGYTYSKIVDRKKLIEDFGLTNIVNIDKVMVAPLVAYKDAQWKELHEGNGRPILINLMKMLNITPFYYKEIQSKQYEILK